ncbi:MAG: O-antigen ligase family protein [Acidobacteriota bacterium]
MKNFSDLKKFIFNNDNFLFTLMLIFLFSSNFSIAVCYMTFSLILIFASYKMLKEKTKIQLPPFFKYLVLFSITTIISTIFAIDPLNSLNDNKELLIFLLVPVYVLILDRKRKVQIAIYTLLFSSFFSSLTGIITSLNKGISLSHRLKGFTSHWMTYSGLLMLVFIFFFIYTALREKGKQKYLNFILLSIVLISILLSLTRQVWVGIIVSIFIFIVFYFKKKPVFPVILIISLLILTLILPGSIKKRALSIFDINNETNKDRIYMAYTAIEMIKDYPLTGVGADNVKKVFRKYRHPDAKKDNPHLHNNFLQIGAERGLVSLAIFLILFLKIFSDLIKLIKHGDSYERNFSIPVLFLLIGFLTAGMFEYNFGDSEIKFILFFFLTLPFLKPEEE